MNFLYFGLLLLLTGIAGYQVAERVCRHLVRIGNRHANAIRIVIFLGSLLVMIAIVTLWVGVNFRLER